MSTIGDRRSVEKDYSAIRESRNPPIWRNKKEKRGYIRGEILELKKKLDKTEYDKIRIVCLVK